MEHAQRGKLNGWLASSSIVLILILMEHAQREIWQIAIYIHVTGVLILILMEHAQRENKQYDNKKAVCGGLNPYFNGTCSKRKMTTC